MNLLTLHHMFVFYRGRFGVGSHFSLMNAMRHLPQTEIVCSLYSGMTG